MKTFLMAWWRGLGVLALYICLSIVMGALGLLAGAVPAIVGLPLLVLGVPPLAFWTAKLLYPEIVQEKVASLEAGSDAKQ